MQVEHFHTERGVYVFRMEGVETRMHAHPAMEVLLSEQGCLDVHTTGAVLRGLRCVVIEANVRHRIQASGGVRVLMTEHSTLLIRNHFRESAGKELVPGVWAIGEDLAILMDQWIRTMLDYSVPTDHDERIHTILACLDERSVRSDEAFARLQQVTGLSAGRLSHVFKEAMGVSIRKYIVWTRLKYAIAHYLYHREDLFSSLVAEGFYDQSHFSRSFTSMLGIPPSAVYNSRTVQVATGSPR